MRYPDSYLFSHDIDWFCMVDGAFIHVASAGGRIPDGINDVERLRNLQHQVEMLPDIYDENEIEYNEEGIADVLRSSEGQGWEEYIESFSRMARKGFVSFDRTDIAHPTDERYHLVCKPGRLDRKPQGIQLPDLSDLFINEQIREGLKRWL